MGMKLSITRETFSPAEDQTWLGSAHGTNECESITLDASSFVDTFTDGIVPSGVVVSIDTGSDLAVLGADGGGAVYHLFTTTDLHGTTAETAVDTPAAGFWHGQIIVANLPADHGLDVAAAALLPQVNYVGEVPA